MDIKSLLDRCEAQIFHCHEVQKHWLGNAGLTGSQKIELQRAVDATFNEMRKDISKCTPESLKKYSAIWKQAKEIVQSTSVLARILNWFVGSQPIQFKSKNALELNALKSKLLASQTGHFDKYSIDKAEMLLDNLKTTTELLFETDVSMSQVRNSFKECQKVLKALKANRASSNFVTRKIYAERYKALDKGIAEIEAKFKFVNKCCNVNIMPHLGVKYEDLLFTDHHYYERMIHYGIKFRDATNPTFNLVDKKPLNELINANGSVQSLTKELAKVYKKYQETGLCEIRQVHKDGLYQRKSLKGMTESEFIALALAQNSEDPSKINVSNIKIVVIDKKISIEQLKKMKILGDFQSRQTISSYFKPTGNYAKDKVEVLKLYKKLKKESTSITVKNPVPSTRVKKLLQNVVPKELLNFLSPPEGGIKPSKTYFVPLLSPDQFLELILPKDGKTPNLSLMTVENLDKPRTLLYDGMDFYKDGFIKKEQITTDELMPHAMDLKPQKNFTVEVYVKHDGVVPGITSNVHAAICARTPSGEEYSFGFSAQGNYGIGNLGLKKGDLDFFDKAIFYNKNTSKAVFQLPDAAAFNKFIKWAEAQKQIKPAYHPLYRNCAGFANEAVNFMKENCGAKKLKRCISNPLRIGQQKVIQFGFKTLLNLSQWVPQLRKHVNIKDGYAVDPTSNQGCTRLSIDQVRKGALIPFMPADFVAGH